jgi:transketolase
MSSEENPPMTAVQPKTVTEPVIEGTAEPQATHDEMVNVIRILAADAVQRANSGHPGLPMGMANVATVLWTRFLKFDPTRPDWQDRDRFILSAGHGSMLLYSLLHLSGYEEITIDEIKNFRQLGSKTPGHPEFEISAGIETTTGPLAQGLGNAVGLALAERLRNTRVGDDIVSHYTYCIVGDGCLMEGLSHESISLAGVLGLSKLIVLWDDNRICIDGPTALTVADNQLARFEACGWDAQVVDGEDPEAVANAIAMARLSDKPSLIDCRTTIGYGAPTKAGTSATHGAPLGEQEIVGVRENLNWPYPPFEIPDHILRAWRKLGRRGIAGSTTPRRPSSNGPASANWRRGGRCRSTTSNASWPTSVRSGRPARRRARPWKSSPPRSPR